MSPITGISEEPLGTGRLFATSPPDTSSNGAAAPDTGQLFANEMDDAIARQGGERSLESRQADVRARRAVRRDSFEGEMDHLELRDEEGQESPTALEGPAAALAPRTTQPVEGRAGFESVAPPGPSPLHKEGVAPSPQSTTPPPSVPETPAAVPQTEMAQLARVAAQGGMKAVGMQPVSASDARVEATTQAFLDAARGSSAKGSARTGSAAQPQPRTDPEMIERANEIMRQIRLSIAPGATQVTLDLEPAALGRLWIRMSFRGGKLGAQVRAEKQETLDALAPKLEELRQLFADRGIEADTIELELGFREGSSDSRPETFSERIGRSASPTHNSLRAHEEGDDASARPSRVSSDADGIDTYA